MTRVEKLRSVNLEFPIYTVHDEAFRPYGRVLNDFDTAGLTAAAQEAVLMPLAGSRYVDTLAMLEQHPDAEALRNLYWGQLDTQLGLCLGHSNSLNALEWHTCSEVNIGVTELVLLLADRRDLVDGRLDSRSVKAFYLDRNEMIEVYATTMHFCPCEVTENGFSCIVALPRGTNTPLDVGRTKSRCLWAKNKWLLAHEENVSLVGRGAIAGIYGPNWAITPISEKEC